MKVTDVVGQVIEVGDYGLYVEDESIFGSSPVKVLDINKNSYGDIQVYVELSFKVKTKVDPARFYISPRDIILTKTAVKA